MLTDFRFAFRQLARSPSVTAVAVITLALGIGANSALFAVANAIFFRPMAGVQHPSGLVWITATSRGRLLRGISFVDAARLRRDLPLVEQMATIVQAHLSVQTPGDPVRVDGELVSGEYFGMIGAPFALGRGFTATEDSAALAHPVMVLSHRLWQSGFGGDSSILGRTVRVNGLPVTVLGVTVAGFNGLQINEGWHGVWVPSSLLPALMPAWKSLLTDATVSEVQLVARLRAAGDRGQVDADLAWVAALIRADAPARRGDWTLRTYDASTGTPPGGAASVRPILILSFTVTALILLICCANVGNLLLARALGRRREIATRLSLGASRGRIARQLLTEALVLAGVAAGVGVVLATWGVDLLLRFALPLPLDVPLDFRVLAMSVGFAIATAMLSGLAPALHATRGGLAAGLRSSSTGVGASDGPGESRLQRGLVVAQVALSLLLLTTSGLFLRSLDRARRVDVGFDASERVLAMSYEMSAQGTADSARSAGVAAQVLDRVRALPGVESAATTTFLPLMEWAGTMATVERAVQNGSTQPGGGKRLTSFNAVSSEYFHTIGIPLIMGRDFTKNDHRGAPLVAIVSERFARDALGGTPPIGARISLDSATGPWRTIVGVVADAVVRDLTGSGRGAVYVPSAQRSWGLTSLLVRASQGSGRSLAPAVRDVLRGLSPLTPVYRTLTLDEVRREATRSQRVGAVVLALFGALALVLASVGIGAALLFAVQQRTREIGIRMALGANRNAVVALVLRRGLHLTLMGIGIGLVLALAGTRLLRSMLFGVSPADGITFVGISALFIAVAALASWLPARRAARVDPALTMRAE